MARSPASCTAGAGAYSLGGFNEQMPRRPAALPERGGACAGGKRTNAPPACSPAPQGLGLCRGETNKYPHRLSPPRRGGLRGGGRGPTGPRRYPASTERKQGSWGGTVSLLAYTIRTIRWSYETRPWWGPGHPGRRPGDYTRGHSPSTRANTPPVHTPPRVQG